MDGKTKCRILKGIRKRIAEINGIEYEPHPCNNRGNCKGTCVMCDYELSWLWLQLQEKVAKGYRVYLSKKEIEQFEIEQRLLNECAVCTSGI